MTTKKSKKPLDLSGLKKGAFTAQAKRAKKTVKGMAKSVVGNPKKHSETTRKRAQFAINAAKWDKK